MPGIRVDIATRRTHCYANARRIIAARRTHRYANTRPWIILNSVLSNIFDIVELSVALSRRIEPLHAFNRIIRRRLADIQVSDRCATSYDFRGTLLQLAAVRALRLLYPHCENDFNLRYLDFVYLQTALCLQWSFNDRPILDIAWNNHKLLKDMCSPSSACIILALHNGFAHTARAVSFSEKKIASVIRYPDQILAFYQVNKVRNPKNIEIVPVNRHTLLMLTKIIKQNKAIICAPDGFISETGRFDSLSLAMFKLAEYSRVPLYFVDYLIDDSGILHGFIKGPIENRAAESAAEDFLSYCKSLSGRVITIKNG